MKNKIKPKKIFIFAVALAVFVIGGVLMSKNISLAQDAQWRQVNYPVSFIDSIK